eukprot:XP_011617000.1 PREDICTED: adenomatous polyposis coli protein 2-like [Takifugu rubripes]
MTNAEATYDQLAHQVAALRKENCHLRRELEDNSNQLSKLETETFGMKEVLKQLQSKLEQEAGTLASSGRSDVLHQLKELHMDLTRYYELKQPHNSRYLMDSLAGLGPTNVAGSKREDFVAPPASCCSPVLATATPAMDLIRQQLEFEAQQVQSVMEERFGTNDEMIQRTQATKESTLKSILSALWNLSAHSIDNKVAICSVDGALGFLVSTLTYRCQTNSLAIIESGGGILRNVSSLVATREDYRQILRDHNCLQTLLQHLRSHSLTIEVLKQLQSKLEQEAGTLASSGRSDVLHQLKELHMDLTRYYELKQPHNSRYLMDSLAGLGPTNVAGSKREDFVAPPASCCSPVLATATPAATLCSKRSCLQALVAQLASDSEELHQVVSSILRNLSWRADINSKRVLRDIGCVSALMTCALQATKESTLKSILSALWNLSAHSIDNKVAICSVDGALGFLVSTLTYRCQTNSLAIIESGGGILRNVSSLVATREDYRQILRDHNCLQTLLQHLRSHSLTIVSNACGTLWNLSARSSKDQELLWELGAVSMLRNLIHSKHKMIAMGSAAALRNLLTNRPLKYKDTAVVSPGSCMPSLYMRKQKALEAELDAKHLAETFDIIERQNPRQLTLNRPLRHIESLAKDYASDSGCFDDDEAPSVPSNLDTGSFSMLSMFLTNSNFSQNQQRKRDNEPERDGDSPASGENKYPADAVSAAADKLAQKITNTVAKIDRLVDDITMHTSSEDSFSLCSEDHLADWPYGPHELNDQTKSPSLLSHLCDTSSVVHRDRFSRARALLRLKTAQSSLSTDSLNSGSTSDGYCGSKDQLQPVTRALMMQQRPKQLDLKLAHKDYQEADSSLCSNTNRQEIPERDSVDNKHSPVADGGKKQVQPVQTPVSASTKVSSDVSMASIKLSPSYQQVPSIQSVAKFGVEKASGDVQTAQAMRKQPSVPTAMTAASITKAPTLASTKSPNIGTMETVQKYSVENTPICFSRCSSLSSLSSGDGALDAQSDNEMESDSSLEIIDVEDEDLVKKAEEDETLEDLTDSLLLMTDSKSFPSKDTGPVSKTCSSKKEKVFLRAVSPAIVEDQSPSSSSEHYIHETPLVMSRCSSVSSLGSFESPSIVSSIQSDPCSEMIDGTISPSDLPDSPGQTMPPSRSKTPCCLESHVQETQTAGIVSQWEGSLRTFMEIADSKDRLSLPPDLDTMIYFTVEKPTENFSCASSLSALPLHEHYIQKDVELKLTPLLQQGDKNLLCHDEEGQEFDNGERYSEGNSDDDIEILKECINSAMPSKFRKVRPSLMTQIPPHLVSSQTHKPIHLPVYMMFPNGKTQICPGRKVIVSHKDLKLDDSSLTDSAEGTPGNFSTTTSLSDDTLQYPVKHRGSKDCLSTSIIKEQELDDEKRIEDLRIFSHFHKLNRTNNPGTQKNRHITPTQRVLMQSKEIKEPSSIGTLPGHGPGPAKEELYSTSKDAKKFLLWFIANLDSIQTEEDNIPELAKQSKAGTVSGVRQQQDKDTFKRHASSPSINILSRVTSRSSLRSSSSDSSSRAKSEDETKKYGQKSRVLDRATWRRIRDEDVPHILKSTLPANALPLVASPEGDQPKLQAPLGKLPTILLASRKTSDATVQTEDFSNKISSSTSPTVEVGPEIAEETVRPAPLRNEGTTSGNNLQDGDSDCLLKSLSNASMGTPDNHAGGSGPVYFRQGTPSKSARITPFNYTPNPLACSKSAQNQAAKTNEKQAEGRES